MNRLRTRPAAVAGNLSRVLALLLALAAASAARAQHVLRDDPNGGDCRGASLGTWEPAAHRCTLAADLRGTIELAGDGLTLDGGGHRIRPRPGDEVAIRARGHDGLRVANVVTSGFASAIVISGGSGHRVERNRVTGGPAPAGAGPGAGAAAPPPCGIELSSVVDTVVVSNRVENQVGPGICLHPAERTDVRDNLLRRNGGGGADLQGADANVLRANEIEGGAPAGGAAAGITLFASRGNLLAGNVATRLAGACVALDTADGNVVVFNTLTQCPGGAVAVTTSNDNKIVCNETADGNLGVDDSAGSARNLAALNNHYRADTARDNALGANRFDLPRPAGGSYWEVNGPFCADADGDGFCDVPFGFVGNADNLPRVRAIPWRLIPEICFVPFLPQREEPPPQGVDATLRVRPGAN